MEQKSLFIVGLMTWKNTRHESRHDTASKREGKSRENGTQARRGSEVGRALSPFHPPVRLYRLWAVCARCLIPLHALDGKNIWEGRRRPVGWGV